MVQIRHLLSFAFWAFACNAAALTRRAPTPGQLSQVTDFGDNPTNVGFYIYVPQSLASNPAVVVAIHYCTLPCLSEAPLISQGTGTAQAYYTGTSWAQYAETHGFIVIYPESPYEGGCWDVSSESTLTNGGGGNSNSIANMVNWTLEQYTADASRVYMMGSSSGAMMTV